MAGMEVTTDIQETKETSKGRLEKTVLDNFSKLSNSHENIRVKSALNLLRYVSENAQNDSTELKYVLKRLVRGLGAPTSNARAGYYSTLAALLNLDVNINVADILELVKLELHKSGKNSDSENADICIGQILCCGAIIRSQLWKYCNEEYQKQILEILNIASKERTYLGLIGFSYVSDLLEKLSEKQVQNVLMPQIYPEIAKPWTDQTLDSLLLLFNLKQKCPVVCNKKFIKKIFEAPEIICTENLEQVCNVLMKIPRVSSIKHPIYNVVVKEIKPQILPEFFNELDKHLNIPNRNRLLLFIKILTYTYENMIEGNKEYLEQIPKIVTKNFIIQLLGYFRVLNKKQKDKEYQKSVHSLFEAIVNVMKLERVSSTVKIAVLKKLLFHPGIFVFEKVTKSKIIQQITLTLDSDGVKQLSLVYKGVMDGTERLDSENDSEKWVNNDRLYSAHLLIKLLNLPSVKDENKWKVEQLAYLMEISLCKELSGINVGRELAESIKNAFFGALDLKLSKLEELHFILLQLVKTLNSKLTPDNLEIILRTPISSETYDLWQKTLNIACKIENKRKKNCLNSVFLTLFLHMGLQLFNDIKLATDSLNELFLCYDRVKREKKRKNLKDSTISENETTGHLENDPLWIEVVIDLFLNLLSHNSHLLRNIINCVFPHLCQYMTPTTIHQILSVLDPKNEDPLSKGTESSGESEDDESEAGSGSEQEDSSESEEDPENNETVTDKLRMALHQALSNGNRQTDDESIDLDEMSDSEGEKLDKALSDVFKQFKPNHGKRKKQSKDQEALTHFRVRVLDLIEIYLNSSPSMLLTLEIMLPLLQSVEFSIRDEHQKPLNDRLKSILKKLLGLKFSNTEGVDSQMLVDLLKSLLDKGSKNVFIVQDMEQQISDCCVFVVKCSEMLRNIETSKKSKKQLKNSILEVFSGELYIFFTKRDCLTPYVLFKSLFQLSWDGNIGLGMILLSFLFSDEVRQFKKSQVAELLCIFYSNQRFLSQHVEEVQIKMEESHQNFSEMVIAFFKNLCQDPDKNIKERFICLLFNLLTCLKHSPIKTNIVWSEIAESVREYRSYKSFSTDAKISFNKLCRALGVPNIVQMKNNVTKLAKVISDNPENTSSQQEEVSEKKKRKKATKEKLKLKKETKQMRMGELSKGLNGMIFESGESDMFDEPKSNGEVVKMKKTKTGKNNRQSMKNNHSIDSQDEPKMSGIDTNGELFYEKDDEINAIQNKSLNIIKSTDKVGKMKKRRMSVINANEDLRDANEEDNEKTFVGNEHNESQDLKAWTNIDVKSKKATTKSIDTNQNSVGKRRYSEARPIKKKKRKLSE